MKIKDCPRYVDCKKDDIECPCNDINQIRGKSVKLQLRRNAVAKLLANGTTLPSNLDKIRDEKLLAFTGAALYYKGGGWWTLSGYAYDGSDVNELIVAML